MVLSAEIDGIDVHSTIVCPVVSESDDQLNASLLSQRDELVKVL